MQFKYLSRSSQDYSLFQRAYLPMRYGGYWRRSSLIRSCKAIKRSCGCIFSCWPRMLLSPACQDISFSALFKIQITRRNSTSKLNPASRSSLLSQLCSPSWSTSSSIIGRASKVISSKRAPMRQMRQWLPPAPQHLWPSLNESCSTRRTRLARNNRWATHPNPWIWRARISKTCGVCSSSWWSSKTCRLWDRIQTLFKWRSLTRILPRKSNQLPSTLTSQNSKESERAPIDNRPYKNWRAS